MNVGRAQARAALSFSREILAAEIAGDDQLVELLSALCGEVLEAIGSSDAAETPGDTS